MKLPGLAALLLSLPLSMKAQAAAPPLPQGDRLTFVLILSRHGVRSPTKPASQLNPSSARPWPAWEVEPGELTPRGADLLRLFGTYDRLWMQQAELLPKTACPPAGAAFFWADTDHRTLESAAALAGSILPGCRVPVHSLAADDQDPLFHPLAAGVAPPAAEAAVAALNTRLHGDPEQSVTANRAALDLLAHVLAPDAAHPPQKPLYGVPASLAPGSGDHMVALLGPLATSSTLSENLLLEYADGKPMQDVGWGQVDEPSLRTLLSLHSAYFDLMHRTPLLAQAEASNLLEHILDTLQQAATGQPTPGALGPVGECLVVLAGHDTNLASLSALLDIHWQLDGRPDDTPPGSQLGFELWHNAGTGTDTVKLTYRMQTLQQLRQQEPLSLSHPPAGQSLTAFECPSCPLSRFSTLARKALDPRFTTGAR